MPNPEASMPQITNSDVAAIAADIGEQLRFKDDPEFICYGHPTWVVKGTFSDEPENTVAVRLRHTLDVEQSLEETNQQIELVQQLGRHGARVLKFLGEAWIEPGKRDIPGAFIASMSRYLPGKASEYEYGAAIASMHNASRHIDTDNYKLMDPLSSITSVKTAIAYAKESEQAGKPVRINDVVVTGEHVEALERIFQRATRCRIDLFELAALNDSPLVVVQEDIYSNNVGKSDTGVGTLMDIDPFVGPAAMDFGRTIHDWPRFKGPGNNNNTRAYKAGYMDTIESGELPDSAELSLAAAFSECRTPLIVTSLAINGLRNGFQGDEWQLREGLRRLGTIGHPEMEWFSDDNTRRIAARSQHS